MMMMKIIIIIIIIIVTISLTVWKNIVLGCYSSIDRTLRNSTKQLRRNFVVTAVTDEIKAVHERLLCVKFVTLRYVSLSCVTYCYEFSSAEFSLVLRLELDS